MNKIRLERWLYEVAVERCWWKAKSLLKSIKMHSHSAITKEKDIPWYHIMSYDGDSSREMVSSSCDSIKFFIKSSLMS
ncbi:hypothetical protein Hanom_Chr16g01521541 [Helianthus anomalus]